MANIVAMPKGPTGPWVTLVRCGHLGRGACSACIVRDWPVPIEADSSPRIDPAARPGSSSKSPGGPPSVSDEAASRLGAGVDR